MGEHKILIKSDRLSVLEKTINYFKSDIMILYTFFAILMKCIVFLGFLLSENHLSIDLMNALKESSKHIGYYCGFALIYLSVAFLFKNRLRLWYLVSINLIISVILIIDVWYYRYVGTMPSFYVIMQTANLENMWEGIITIMRVMDAVFIIDIFVLIFIVIKYKNLYKSIKTKLYWFVILSFFASVCILFRPLSHYFSDNPHAKGAFKVVDNEKSTINLSAIGYHILDVYTFLKDYRPYKLSGNEMKEISEWLNNNMEILPDNKYKGLFKDKNLLVIQVESLENCVIGKSINGQEVTPNLNKLLNNSIYFSNIYEQVNEGVSSDADFLINTSIYPVRKGSTFFRYPYNQYNSLPILMKDEGYSTLAIHPDKGSFWNWMPALKSIGFDKCIDSSSFTIDETINLGLSDASYLRQVEPIVVRQKQPFYTFLVTLSSHSPFNLPNHLRDLKLNESLDSTYLGGYLQSIHYTDKQIGKFIDNLRRDGTLDNTVVMIYGDHTGVNKYYVESLKEINIPERWWSENNKRIPLIIYNMGIEDEEIKTIGGQVDIMPTIAYLMGIDEKRYINSIIGRNLLKTDRNFSVFSNGEYIGEDAGDEEKGKILEGLNISDKIIRGNYFEGFLKKMSDNKAVAK
jgi:lipoteichoic acid synthase